MAENINISFAPNKAASESQRIADLEQYVSTLTERTKFAFASIIEEYNDTADDDRTVNMIYQAVSESGSDVGQFTSEYFSEIFNDYENNIATHPYSHAEGFRTSAKGLQAHAEGCGTTAGDNSAHAEGQDTTASAYASHAEGEKCQATGWACHAEGGSTVAGNMYSHAEGHSSSATAPSSHAEGEYTQATAFASHAEGQKCIASGQYSHAGGNESEAKDYCSFVHGYGLKTARRFEAVFGKYNDCDNPSLFSIGCGQSEEYRENALILNDVGDLQIKGKYKASNGYDFSNAIASSTALGAIKIGENLSISEDGTLSANVGEYTLPTATADTLGGVKIGDNISVTADGTISVDLSTYLKSTDISEWAKQSDKPTYTASEIGLGNVDNTADADKPISTATQTALDGKADTGHTHTVSDITDMPAYLTEETDPTVPAWAKQAEKPVYTADEVGAAAKKHTHTKSEITDFPALGTAAGKNATDFYPAKAANVLGGDYNELKTNGIFEMQGNAAHPTSNTPNGIHTNNNFYVQVFYRNPKFFTQIATSVRSDKTQYIRSLDNGVWNNWEKIKSGDADTLDGKHASDFAVDIKAAVNAVSIGGRNIVTGSAKLTIGTGKRAKGHWRTSGSVVTASTHVSGVPYADDLTVCVLTATAVNTDGGIVQDGVLLNKDEYYTLSCWVRNSSDNSVKCILQPFWKSSTDTSERKGFTLSAYSDWQRLSFTSTKKPAVNDNYSAGYVYVNANTAGASIQICGVKLETGTKATDWTPAPEDVERRITSLESRVAALEAAAVSGGEV